MPNYQIEKFTFESPYPIVIDVNDPKCLRFEYNQRVLMNDYTYGLEFVERIGYSAQYEDAMTLDMKTKINRVHKSLIHYVLAQARLWLCDRFQGPQVLPIQEFPNAQIFHAIRLHYEGGWNRLVQDCVNGVK